MSTVSFSTCFHDFVVVDEGVVVCEGGGQGGGEVVRHLHIVLQLPLDSVGLNLCSTTREMIFSVPHILLLD